MDEEKKFFSSLCDKLEVISDRNNEAFERLCDKLDEFDKHLKSTRSILTTPQDEHDYAGASHEDREVSFKTNLKVGAHKLSSSKKNPTVSSLGKLDAQAPKLISENLQAEYRSLADVYSQQQVPEYLKFKGSKAGIKAEKCETATIVSNAARYAELILKICERVNSHMGESEFCVNDHLSHIYSVAAAQVRYLQEEQSTLVMGNRFGPRVGQIFKDLRQHTSTFTPDAIEDAKSAIALAGAEENSRPPRQQQSNFQRGNFRFRGGRGRARGGGQFALNQYTDQQNPGFVPRQMSYERNNPQTNE